MSASAKSKGIEAFLGEIHREHEGKIAALNGEIEELKERVTQLNCENKQLAGEKIELRTEFYKCEAQLSTLQTQLEQAEARTEHFSNLYLAAFALHREHNWQAVLNRLFEILNNQIGAAEFTVAWRQPDGSFQTIIQESSGNNQPPTIEKIDELFQTGEPQYDSGDSVALIPLLIVREGVGYITITKLLSHKAKFTNDDKKLLLSLTQLASTAIQAAQALPAYRAAQAQRTAEAEIAKAATQEWSAAPTSLLDYSAILPAAPQDFAESQMELTIVSIVSNAASEPAAAPPEPKPQKASLLFRQSAVLKK